MKMQDIFLRRLFLSEFDTVLDSLSQQRPEFDKLALRRACESQLELLINPRTHIQFDAYSDLPDCTASITRLDRNVISIGEENDLSNVEREALKFSLLRLKPWRKGPFSLFGLEIDTEWQSFMKWNRLLPRLPDLRNKLVLDMGCGLGYYMFRMLALQPRFVLGVDPSTLFFFQYLTIQKYSQERRLGFLPIGWKQCDGFKRYFDCIFCMGLLYHHRSPMELLSLLQSSLKPKGTLILETVIYPGDDSVALVPAKNYAGMTRVYFLPTMTCLRNWINRTGFELVDELFLERTSILEQRASAWSSAVSLRDFLDKRDSSLTVEGYHRPIRAGLLLRKKGRKPSDFSSLRKH